MLNVAASSQIEQYNYRDHDNTAYNIKSNYREKEFLVVTVIVSVYMALYKEVR
jgi:acetyl-CoA acetyltransferase